jgi:hypothetical protein
MQINKDGVETQMRKKIENQQKQTKCKFRQTPVADSVKYSKAKREMH